MEGFIFLHRTILEWEWYKNKNTLIVFIYLLLKANHKNGRWQGIEIKRGQILTSLKNIEYNNDVTFQQARTALNHLQKTKEITCKVTNKFTLITVCNYDKYNSKNYVINKQNNKQITSKITSEQQTDNKQSTYNNNNNNNNNVNKNNNINKEEALFCKNFIDKYLEFQNTNKDIIFKEEKIEKDDVLFFCRILIENEYNSETISNDLEIIFNNYSLLPSFLQQKTFTIMSFIKYFAEICNCIKNTATKKKKNNFDKADYIKNTLENIINK